MIKSIFLKLVQFYICCLYLYLQTKIQKCYLGVRFNVHKDQNSYYRYVMIEEWDCQANLLGHLKQPYLKTFKDACQTKQ